MDDEYDEDEYAPFQDEGYGSADQPGFEPMDGPGLFDEPEETVEEPAAAPATEAVTPPLSTQARRPEAPPAPLALYRRYRPETFAEVIGQDHVTVPLQRALTGNRVNHAYLFSGPRGCGKTTSARILARCLNCAEGPTPTPCGRCDSCRDLARGGPGSIDVIEIDAASHGGVDDARDLRERAYFAPVASRYKIYIIDEAHMVTAQGFNALLKLVEEPPPHAKFIFATTEPEKVIGTIRSRTHHYPFRLVPPRLLTDYLGEICRTEDVAVDQAALPLVVRAGGGSVRDSLSVLDQLLGGAGDEGISHEQAAALLGYTPDALLDEIMDAFAAGDAAGVFRTVDKVIEVGQDPRRFAEDLLRRLRDLVILSAVPEAVTNGLLDVAADQAQRLQTQVSGMGAGELTRAAEVIATGLTDMRGTTAPRLHLELMCSRVLLPGADTDERGLHARMDRLERRVGMMGTPDADAARVRPAAAVDEPAARAERPPRQQPAAAAPAPTHESAPAAEAAPEPQEQKAAPAAEQRRPAGEPPRRRPAGAPPRTGTPAQPEPAPAPASAPSASSGGRPGQLSAAELRRVWPNVLEEVKRRRRFTFMLLSQHAQVLDVADGVLRLGFGQAGARDNFGGGGSADVLADSIIEVIGVELQINAVVADAPQGRQEQARPEPAPQGRQQRPADSPPADSARPSDPPPAQRPAGAPPATSSPTPTEPPGEPYPEVEAEVSSDDEVLDSSHNAEELLSNAFGAEIIAVRDVDDGGSRA